jgi:hypothetical protein
LAEEKGFAIGREGQTTIERDGLIESEDAGRLASGKDEEFNSAVRRKIQVQEVDSATSNVPSKPTTSVNWDAGFLATTKGLS